MDCPKCGSNDVFVYDSVVNLQEDWIEINSQCNNCGVCLEVDATISVDKIVDIS